MANTLLASACPALIVPSAVTYATQDSPPTSMLIVTGEQGALVSNRVNRNNARQDYSARFASGMYCIGEGLALSTVSGLTINIAAGVIVADGLLWSTAGGSVPSLPNNQARVWIWAVRVAPIGDPTPSPATLTFTYTTTTTPPAGAVCLLGSCSTGASAITPGSIDTSGVPYSKGPEVWRYSGDIGVPTDSPNAALRFFHQSSDSLWKWDGSRYRQVTGGLPLVKSTIAAAEAECVPAGYQARVYDNFSVIGSLTVAGKMRFEA